MKNKYFLHILDTMTGADGGASFVKTKMLIEDMEKRFDNGDVQAGKVLDIVKHFSGLITIANKGQ